MKDAVVKWSEVLGYDADGHAFEFSAWEPMTLIPCQCSSKWVHVLNQRRRIEIGSAFQMLFLRCSGPQTPVASMSLSFGTPKTINFPFAQNG